MLDKDTQQLLQIRREAQLKLDEVDKEINATLKMYMDKRSEAVAKVEEITEKQIEPLKEEISLLDNVIQKFCSEGGIDKFSNDFHSIYKTDSVSFKAVDWDSIYKFIKDYKGEFDINSIIKKDLNSRGLKKFVEENAKCPDGIEQSSFTKYSFRKK